MRPKDSRPVWGEGAGKVPDGNSPTPYSTARPVRGGADGKVLTEQLASRLLHIVVGFEHEADARRFRDAMRARAWRSLR